MKRNFVKTHPAITASLLALVLFGAPPFAVGAEKTPEQLAAAAEKGEAEAQFQLGRLYFRGEAVPKDYPKAFALIQKAAAQGHAEAEGTMGLFYSGGLSVPKDEVKAVAWFQKGADKGVAKAQFNLGQMLLTGRGVARDEPAGLVWIQRAADQGLTEAVAAQGEAYFFGKSGQPQDFAKAYPLLLKAAEAGQGNAQNSVGVMLLEGRGVTINLDEAAQWFRKAAEQGNLKGQANLGHFLFNPIRDKALQIEGLKWLMIAARQGENTSQRTLQEVIPKLPEADVAEARRQAALPIPPQKAATP